METETGRCLWPQFSVLLFLFLLSQFVEFFGQGWTVMEGICSWELLLRRRQVKAWNQPPRKHRSMVLHATPWYSTLQVAIDLDMGFKWFYSNIYIYNTVNSQNVGTAKGWMHTSMNYDLRCVSFTAFCSSAVFFSSASIVSIKPEALKHQIRMVLRSWKSNWKTHKNAIYLMKMSWNAPEILQTHASSGGFHSEASVLSVCFVIYITSWASTSSTLH